MGDPDDDIDRMMYVFGSTIIVIGVVVVTVVIAGVVAVLTGQ